MGGIIIIFSVVISTILWSDLGNQYVLILLFGILSFGLIGFYDDYKKLIKKTAMALKEDLNFYFK